jgi:hypothetical protein
MKIELDPTTLVRSDAFKQVHTDIEARCKAYAIEQVKEVSEKLKHVSGDTMHEEVQKTLLGSDFIQAFADLVVSKARTAGISLPALKGTISRKLRGSAAAKAINTYARPGQSKLEGKRAVALFGDKGSGKTHEAYHESVALYAGKENVTLIDCHADIMPEQLFGHPCAEGDGTPALGWRDGSVTEAFRRQIEEGVPQVVIFDEFLQLPSTSLNALKSLLGGLGDNYICTTGKPTGAVGSARGVEKLSCPITDIGFIMTSNVGGRYEVRDIDDAMRSRLKIVHMDCKITDIKRVIKPIIKQRQDAYGWSEEASTWLLSALTSIHTDTKRFANNHELEAYAGTRELMGILTQLEHPAEILNVFDERSVLCERPYFVAVDDFGQPNPDQKAKYKALGDSMKSKAKAFKNEDARSDDDKSRFDALLRHVIIGD